MHLINGSHFNSMVGLYSLVNDEDNKEQKQEKTIGNNLVGSIERAFHSISFCGSTKFAFVLENDANEDGNFDFLGGGGGGQSA